MAPSALTHSKRTFVFQCKGKSVSTSAALKGPKYRRQLCLEHVLATRVHCLGCGEVQTYHSHKFALLANRIFLALGGGTADILQHCRIVVYRRMFPRHLWQSRFDNDARNVGSSGRKCKFDVGCTYARQPRFSQPLTNKTICCRGSCFGVLGGFMF